MSVNLIFGFLFVIGAISTIIGIFMLSESEGCESGGAFAFIALGVIPLFIGGCGLYFFFLPH